VPKIVSKAAMMPSSFLFLFVISISNNRKAEQGYCC
jgi:hypothetical protein